MLPSALRQCMKILGCGACESEKASHEQKYVMGGLQDHFD